MNELIPYTIILRSGRVIELRVKSAANMVKDLMTGPERNPESQAHFNVWEDGMIRVDQIDAMGPSATILVKL